MPVLSATSLVEQSLERERRKEYLVGVHLHVDEAAVCIDWRSKRMRRIIGGDDGMVYNIMSLLRMKMVV